MQEPALAESIRADYISIRDYRIGERQWRIVI